MYSLIYCSFYICLFVYQLLTYIECVCLSSNGNERDDAQ